LKPNSRAQIRGHARTTLHYEERICFAVALPFERALELRERECGPKHITADSLNNLGRVLWDQGDLSAAPHMFERALQIREEVFGPAHPKTAASLNNLGSVLQNLSDLNTARFNFDEPSRFEPRYSGENILKRLQVPTWHAYCATNNNFPSGYHCRGKP
jgi:tetratricopeptide (TPR) repeat protein